MKIPTPEERFASDKDRALETLEHLADGFTQLIPVVIEELRLSRKAITLLMKKYPEIIPEIFPEDTHHES